MKKKLNELFDQATPRELDGFSDALNAPALSDETLASIKNKVYTKTKLNPEPKRVQKPRTPRMIWLRVGALAACLCLIVTGVFGGVGLLKDRFSDATAPITQHTPDLPLDNYPPNEVDYANMSMVEYMELFPDFLSYRYMPWHEGYAFAYLEILEVKNGYRYEYNNNCYVVKCRVVADAWNVLEEGSDLNLVCTYKEAEFFETVSSVLLRFPVLDTFVCTSKDGDSVRGMLFDVGLEYLGCFPVEDGKVKLDIMEAYLKANNLKLNYEGNSGISSDPDYVYCTFDDVASIVANEMTVEAAIANLRNVYEKYQTGEYNHLSVALVSQMNYGEYCRVIEGTLTDEDIDKFGFRLAIEYASMPPLVFTELSLSDGTKFEFCTRAEISEKWMKKLVEVDIPSIELAHTDENGKLNAEACVEEIKKREFGYCWTSVYGIEPNDVN